MTAAPSKPPDRPRLSRVIANARATVQLAWRAAPSTFVLIMIGTTLSALIAPAALLLTALFIDGVASRPAELSAPTLMWPLIGLALVGLATRSIGTVVSNAQILFQERVHMAARFRFLRHLAGADISQLEDPAWRDRLQRARADVGWRPYNMTQTLIHVYSSCITLTSLLSALAILDPLLLLFGLLNVLPPIVLRYSINQRLYRLYWTTTRREREHDYLVQIASEPSFAKEVRALLLGDHVVNRAQGLSEDRYQQQRAIYRRANIADLVAGLASAAVLVVAYALISRAALAGTLTVGQVAAVLGAFASVTGHLSALLSALVSIDQHAQFLDDYFSFLATGPQVAAPAQAMPLPKVIERVALEGVSFRYPAGTADAVADVDLELVRGKTIALVGDNGAGKSTIVKLLLRFFDASQGSVKINGIDVRALDPIAWRERIGVLFQDFANYELEVKEGLHFGRIQQPFDIPRAASALKAARADEVIAAVEGGTHGLDTVVGRVLEGGHDLSGGQWQRLALARLLYRDADLWILDEPTANLDPEAEMRVFEELRALTRDKMTVIISHRFSTVRAADEIVVLAGGRVVERGAHDDLVKRGGRYAELFDLQARSYR